MKISRSSLLLYLVGLLGVVVVGCLSASDFSNTAPDHSVVITDIQFWQHPTKDVFTKNSVVVSKVELKNDKKYAIFHVKFPYDPQSSVNDSYFNRLYLDVLRANGWNSYSIQDDEDKITIKVTWDNVNKNITTDFVPFSSSRTDNNKNQ